jgi:hypothetical protein
MYIVEQEAMVGHFHARGIKLQFIIGARLAVRLLIRLTF